MRCTVDGDDAQCRMWEIAENLHRADLTALERSEHVAEWVRLAEQSAHVAPKGSVGHRPQGGINAAVRELGIDRTDAQRSAKVDSIAPAAKQAARDAGLEDNRAALLRVAAEPDAPAQLARVAAEQAKAVARKVDAKATRPPTPITPLPD